MAKSLRLFEEKEEYKDSLKEGIGNNKKQIQGKLDQVKAKRRGNFTILNPEVNGLKYQH